jgi:adenylate cyclase
MKTIVRRHHTRFWIAGIVLLTVSIGWYFSANPAFRGMEENALDLMFGLRYRPSGEKTPEVAVVMVDEKSIEKDFGYYDPLPRRYLARLIDTVASKGARVIAVDIAFYDRLEQLDARGDSILLQAMRSAGNVISVSIWHRQEDGSVRLQQPHPFFAEGLRGVGFANLQISGGGGLSTVREFKPAVDLSDGSRALAFASLAYCLYREKDPDAFIADVLERRSLPLTASAGVIINYTGPPPIWEKQADGDWLQKEEGPTAIFRSSRLTGDLAWPDDLFKDQVVIIGNGGEFVPDRFVTPYYKPSLGNWMYGAEVHANAFLTLLRETYIVPVHSGWVIAVLLLLTIVMVWSTVRLGLIGELGAAFLLIVTVWVTAYSLFSSQGLWVPAMSATLTVLVAYFATSIYQAFTEEKTKRQIKTMFARYAPPAYVEELIKDPTKLELGGEEKEISILFSDIEGFTNISENLSPRQLVELLNQYLGAMTDTIFRQGGSLDKYIGDAIVAVFGAPLPQNEHALHACYAALEMQKRLADLRERWKSAGLPPIRNRIGINTGNVVFGNIGSDIRYDYTGIGDNMNLASRLEGANKLYGTYIMISDFTYQQVRERVIVRDLDVIVVKGRSKPVRVYELLGRANEPLPEATRKLIEHYQDGIELYRKRQWGAAAVKFEQALAHVHTDDASKLYIKRCKAFLAQPPGEDWDGTFHMTEK